MQYRQPSAAARRKRKQQLRRRRAALVFLSVLLVAAIALAVVLGVRSMKEKNVDSPVQSGTIEPPPAAETPPEEILLPEPEKPVIYEEGGANYIDLEGVKVLVANKVYHLTPEFGGENAEANAALDEMIADAASDGISIWLMSGYRSYDTQEAIYNRYVEQWGQEYTDTVSAKAGTSEHQTGLAFDLNSLSDDFAETAEYRWLVENCAAHGFILRYLDGKTWATGYVYEPWHYRYIGDAELAKKIMDSGLCLEEYAGLV